MIKQGMGCNIDINGSRFSPVLKGLLVLIGVSAALCLAPTQATADFITFDLNAAILEYSPTSGTAGTLTVTENTGSVFQVRREDGAGVLDSTQISGNNADFDFNFTLDLTRVGGSTWEANGILEFTDATGAIAANASFDSDSVIILPYGPGMLQIVGTLSNTPPGGVDSTGQRQHLDIPR
ncbi:MAG: hypothetical protein QGG42_21455 [Phycisphaerae bacterium]|jgi:hypothetical protein|nr:hypothetical protein [Phycisphaerae bacterium]